MTGIQGRIDEVFKKQERSQFGPDRYAYLFKPGKYDLDVQVGFYVQVLGLGQSPDDVAITGAVRSKANWMANHNATCNFWRSVENLSVTPTQDRNINVWAVSQATGMRRVHVKGNMNLWDGGWSSGGFLADCRVDGQINSGSQQQWFSRNTQFGKWTGGSWNMVFVGVVNPPAGAWPKAPYTVIDKTPLVREKPYLVIDDAGRYQVMVPDLQTGPTQGTTWSAGKTPAAALPIEQFYLAHPNKDSATSINTALASGKHLLFTPGVYRLDAAVRVTRPGRWSSGWATRLWCRTKARPPWRSPTSTASRWAGSWLTREPPIQRRSSRSASRAARRPTPRTPRSSTTSVAGREGHRPERRPASSRSIPTTSWATIFWLWRADHGRGVGWDSNKNATGLTVNGNNVTIYGLFVEHCQEYQTVWNGNGGRVYFYQSELPYDPPSQDAWRHGTVNGYASYKVGDTVTTHEAWGLGVYHVFRRPGILCESAIETPTAPGIKVHHMLTFRLGGGQQGTGINHVINEMGSSTMSTQKPIVDEGPAPE